KKEITQILNTIPCGSEIGLGVFTERSPAILFMPMELCANYQLIETAVDHLDWRMAWVADSNIGRALNNTLELMMLPALANTRLLFMTDGHEAPPINPDYEPDFSEFRTTDGSVPGAVQLTAQQSAEKNKAVEFKNDGHTKYGVLVGVGGYTPVQIPKFNEDGEQIGFYTADDVPHATRFGVPKDPSKIPGYVPRNAVWGAVAPTGTEHLSRLREDYLKSLAGKANMDYVRLDTADRLFRTLTQDEFALQNQVLTGLGRFPAIVALFCLTVVYLSTSFNTIFFRAKNKLIHSYGKLSASKHQRSFL
ncbi:MAG: hypothetical protein MI865_05680, partial [Proteobacteria bacterium]|nr:hypothetical protein [Pseudomonadota bacterium]